MFWLKLTGTCYHSLCDELTEVELKILTIVDKAVENDELA